MKAKAWLAIIASLTSQSPCASAQINEQTKAEINTMKWTPATKLRLTGSNSVITSLPGYAAVMGAEAVRVQEIIGNSTGNVEAYLVNPAAESEAVLAYVPTGYIKLDDWARIDPTQFLHQLSSLTDEGNVTRISRGISPIHVDKWVQEPTLNPETHTASWIILDHTDAGESELNAVAIKLGRFGTEQITFISKIANVSAATSNLVVVAAAHQFAPGARYEDFIPGTDKSAEYGIAGLVAGIMGVKLVKVVATIGLLVLLKKAGFLLVLPFIWLCRKVFRKRQKAATS